MRYISIFILFILFSCETKEDFYRNHEDPKYKVSLIGIDGSILQTRFAQEYEEEPDWGENSNYRFKYYYWDPKEPGSKYGNIRCFEWQWPMVSSKIERIKNQKAITR